jgi:hypothetical protein
VCQFLIDNSFLIIQFGQTQRRLNVHEDDHHSQCGAVTMSLSRQTIPRVGLVPDDMKIRLIKLTEDAAVDTETYEMIAKVSVCGVRREHRGGCYLKSEQLTFYRDVYASKDLLDWLEK